MIENLSNPQYVFDNYVSKQYYNNDNYLYMLDERLIELPQNNKELQEFTESMYGHTLYVQSINCDNLDNIDVVICAGSPSYYEHFLHNAYYYKGNLRIANPFMKAYHNIIKNKGELFAFKFKYIALELLFSRLFGCYTNIDHHGMDSGYFISGKPPYKEDTTEYDFTYIQSFSDDLRLNPII